MIFKGPSLQNYNILEQNFKIFNVMVPLCIDEMSIVKDHGGNCRVLHVRLECGPRNLEPASVSLGCAAFLPVLQKTFIRDCDMLDLMPGTEMMRNAWVGIPVCLESWISVNNHG